MVKSKRDKKGTGRSGKQVEPVDLDAMAMVSNVNKQKGKSTNASKQMKLKRKSTQEDKGSDVEQPPMIKTPNLGGKKEMPRKIMARRL